MKSKSVLIVGCGDIGIRLGNALLAQGCHVAAVRRNVARLPSDFDGYSADYTQPGSLAFVRELKPDIVVTTFNPFDRSEAGYRRGFTGGMNNLLAALDAHRPARVFMASSTRVYAERAGGWVDEQSALTNDDAWARAIIEAERALLDSEHAGSIVRFAGIYGIAGGRLITRIGRGEIAPEEPLRYTNRIHREDCSEFLAHLIGRVLRGEAAERVYLGVDDYPAPRHEVETWLAQELGVDLTDVQHSSEPVRHNKGHRRCRNSAMKRSGYTLRYKDYRDGYGALLGST